MKMLIRLSSIILKLSAVLHLIYGTAAEIKPKKDMKGHISEELQSDYIPSYQQRLYSDLFSSYNKHIRPVLTHDEVLRVHLGISLFNILTLDSKTGVMVTNNEVILTWNDPNLQWDPALYNDTKILKVFNQDVWQPDIVLYNTAGINYEASQIHTDIIIEYTGNCKLLIHSIFTSSCDLDLQWFPFDQQTCELVFASLTMDVKQMILEEYISDITRYTSNHEFFLENFYSESFTDLDPCCDEPFSMIKFHIQLQRRARFAFFFYLVPGILINVIALMSFWLPAESGEKITLGISSILAMIIFIETMTQKVAPTERLPLAGVYYGACLTMTTLNIGFTVFVLNLNNAGDRGFAVPVWLRKFTVIVGKIACVRLPRDIEDLWEPNMTAKPEHREEESVLCDAVYNDTSSEKSHMTTDLFVQSKTELLEAIHKIMAQQGKLTSMKNQSRRSAEEWKYISRVLDRIFFFIFALATLFFNSIILTSSPFREKFEYCLYGPGNCSEEDEFTSISDIKFALGSRGYGDYH